MRALVLTRHGGPERLQVRELPDPSPRTGELRISVQASGLNFADVAARVGLYPAAPKPPCILGYEVAGHVDGLGAGVTSFREGDPVLALTHFGGQAERVCVPQAQCFPLPSGKTLESAAALPVNFLTAHHLLHWAGSIHAGQRLLIHQAAGGVGTAVVQLARLIGAESFGTASAAKHERLRALGLSHPIDYHRQDVAETIQNLAGPRPLRLALDPIGSESWRHSYQLLAPGGQLLVFGFSGLFQGDRRTVGRVIWGLLRVPRHSALKLMADNRSVGGVDMGGLWESSEVIAPQMQRILELWGQDIVQPLVDRTFPIEEAAEAHRYLQAGKNFGKVVLRF